MNNRGHDHPCGLPRVSRRGSDNTKGVEDGGGREIQIDALRHARFPVGEGLVSPALSTHIRRSRARLR